MDRRNCRVFEFERVCFFHFDKLASFSVLAYSVSCFKRVINIQFDSDLDGIDRITNSDE